MIEHNGKSYDIYDLAYFMEDEQREEIVSHPDWKQGDDQRFWDLFVDRFPQDAERIVARSRSR